MTERRWWIESFTVSNGRATVPVVAVVDESVPWEDRETTRPRSPYPGASPWGAAAVGVPSAAFWLPLWEGSGRDEPPGQLPSQPKRKRTSTVTPRGNPTRPTLFDAD